MNESTLSIDYIHNLIQKYEQVVSCKRENHPPIENLVFEGGGVKGLAYAGAIEVLENEGILAKVKRVAGSSAGGITALLLALGFSSGEIKSIMADEIDFSLLMDRRVSWDPTRVVNAAGMKIGLSDIAMLFKNKGLYKGDSFTDLCKKIVQNKMIKYVKSHIKQAFQEDLKNIHSQKERKIFIQSETNKFFNRYYISDPANITFSQFEKIKNDFPQWQLKSLYVTGTKLSNGSLKIFSSETTPNTSIVDAVRITMSFPFGFEPVLYEGEYYADGGIADNFPMNIFNAQSFQSYGLNQSGVNPCTLGFLVDSLEEINLRWGIENQHDTQTLSFKKFIESLLNGIHSRSELLRDTYTVQAIQINDLGIPTMDLNLDDSTKKRLIDSGREPTQFYFDNYYGNDVINTKLPDYVDIKEKYYTKGGKELSRLIEYEIWPLLDEINKIIRSVESKEIEKKLLDIDELLLKFPESVLTIEKNRFDRIYEMEITLKNLNRYISKVENNIHDSWMSIKKCKKKLKHLNRIENKEKSDSLLNEYQYFVTRKKYFDNESKKLNRKYDEMIKAIELEKNESNSEIFKFLHGKKIVKRMQKIYSDGTLNFLINDLNQHLDIAMEAMRIYQKNYSDPRELSQIDQPFNTIIKTLHPKYESIIKKINLNQSDLEKRIKQCIDLIECMLKMGLKSEISEHYISIYLSAIKKNSLKDEKDDKMIMAKTLFNALLSDLEKNYLLEDYTEVKKIFYEKFFFKIDNQSELYDAGLAAKKAAVQYVEKIIKNKKSEMIKDKWRNADIRFSISDALSKTANQLKTGKWGDEITLSNYADICYNQKYALIENSNSFGKHETNYTVKTVSTKNYDSESSSAITLFSSPPDLIAYILTPENINLKNINNQDKEIIVIFPSILDSKQTFNLSSKHINTREQQFDKVKKEILQALWWSICEAREVAGSKNITFRITIHGEGLAARDAQYLLKNILHEIKHTDENISDISSLHLSLVDPLRVSQQAAVDMKKYLNELKRINRSPPLSAQTIFNVKKRGNNKLKKKKQTFIGEANILSFLTADEADIVVDYRDVTFPYQIVSSSRNDENCLDYILNEKSYIYNQSWFRNLYWVAQGGKDLLNNVFNFQFSSVLSNVINLPMQMAYGRIQNIISPFLMMTNRRNGHKLFSQNTKNTIFYKNLINTSVVNFDKNNEEIHQSSQPLKDFETSRMNIQTLIKQGSRENRLKAKSRPPIENLVFEGSGIKGMAYIGALVSMEKNNLLRSVKRVAGSSSGGIIASLFAVGYTPSELEQLFLKEINFRDLMDEPFSLGGLDSLFAFNGISISVSGLISLFKNKGFYKGDHFESLMKSLIEKKLKEKINNMHMQLLSLNQRSDFFNEHDTIDTNNSERLEKYLEDKLADFMSQENINDLSEITLGQLKKLQKLKPQLGLLDVNVTATDLSNGTLKIFSAKSDANLPLYKAVRMTMSFPGGFMPVFYEGRWYADGGIANNYPMEIFDQPKYLFYGLNDAGVNPATLGILVDSKEEMDSRWGIKTGSTTVLNLFSLVQSVLYGMHNRTEILRDRYNINSIQIIDDIGANGHYQAAPTMDLNLNEESKKRLIENGQKALDHYYKFYIGEDICYTTVDQFSNLEQKYYKMTPRELKHCYQNEVLPLLAQFEVLMPCLEPWRKQCLKSIDDLSLTPDYQSIENLLLKLDNRKYEKQILLKKQKNKTILNEEIKALNRKIDEYEYQLKSYSNEEMDAVRNHAKYQEDLILLDHIQETYHRLLDEKEILLKAGYSKDIALVDRDLIQYRPLLCNNETDKMSENIDSNILEKQFALRPTLLQAFSKVNQNVPQRFVVNPENNGATENLCFLRKSNVF